MRRRKLYSIVAFDALTVEGGLIAPAMLEKIGRREADQQKEADYVVPKGLALRDEIARYYRIGQALFSDFDAIPAPSSQKTSAFVASLLKEVFGFNDVAPVGLRRVEDSAYPVTLEALQGRVPVVVVPPSDGLDRVSGHLPGDGRRRSAASAIQDWLNANDDALWGLCANGLCLRLLRDNPSLTRPAYIEADLRQMFEADAFADFTTLWLLIHASRFGAPGKPATNCVLERWRDAGAKEGLAARDRLRDGVEAALLSLGGGFLSANPELREKLSTGVLPLPNYFLELLRVIYRLIFLLVAEERALLHPTEISLDLRQLYARGYSITALRESAIRAVARDGHHDRWEGVMILFNALARGEPRLGLPALGGLFLPELTINLNNARLPNRALIDAIFRLAWLKDDSSLQPINWRDMEAEELGSVYESLLELTPRISDDARVFQFAEGAETKGNARKTTGSYYTPDSLVQALLDSALDPVLDRAEREADDPAAALLAVKVIDPACGSGHFLLAAARRIAARVARARADGVAGALEFRHALRDVARQCIHGVDRNPMAVELTKVALWIETVEPGKPLGFLDANIRCGDALLGVFDLEAVRAGIPDQAFKPLAGDDKETAKHFAARNRAEKAGQGALDHAGGGGSLPPPPPLAASAKALRALPEDSVEDIAEKERRLAAARRDPAFWRWKLAADLYVAAFLSPKTGGVPENRNSVAIPTTGHVWRAARGEQIYPPLEARAIDLTREACVFHWPLEFPDVMGAGGFDVVLGNPPWERIKLQEQEFFASREPEIAQAANAAARGKLIAKLKEAAPDSRDRALYEAFEQAKRTAEAASVFARVPGEDGGRFPLTGRGDVNTYALFAELFSRLAGASGRTGVIVPTGIATDATTSAFFGELVASGRLASLLSFENEEFIFPGVHHAFRFALLTIQRSTRNTKPEFVFFARQPSQIQDADRRFSLSPENIARINPNTKTAPVFRSGADAELTAKIYARVPVLIDKSKGVEGNPWGMSFMAMFHMSNDSGLFRTAAQLQAEGYRRDGVDWVAETGARPCQATLELAGGGDAYAFNLRGGATQRTERYVPLYEAKMIHQFDHRWATYDNGDSRDATLEEKRHADFEVEPRYWVARHEVADRFADKGWCSDWLICWRRISGIEKIRTVIASATPASGMGDSIFLMLPGKEIYPDLTAALVGCLSSLSLDFVARTKMGGTNLNYYILEQLPVLPPSAYTPDDLAFITPRVLELTYTSHSMAPFAGDLRFDGPPFRWDEDRRAQLRAELDAFYSRAYGLTRDELRYILDPSDVKGTDYPSETFRVLKNNEMKRYGEYRTARLVLDAWDRMEKGELK